MRRSFRDVDPLQPWWVAAATAKSAWLFFGIYAVLALVSLGVYVLTPTAWLFLVGLVFFGLASLLFLASAVYFWAAGRQARDSRR